MKIIRYGYNAPGLFTNFINYLWLALAQNGKYDLNILFIFSKPPIDVSCNLIQHSTFKE